MEVTAENNISLVDTLCQPAVKNVKRGRKRKTHINEQANQKQKA